MRAHWEGEGSICQLRDIVFISALPQLHNLAGCVCVCVCVCTHAKSLHLCLTLLGDLLNPGIEPVSVMNPALVGGFFITSATCLGIFN